MSEIYIDGDACPVKREVMRVADRHGIKVHLVSVTWLRMDEHPLLNRVVVAPGFDAADDWIAEHIGRGDIAITSDILLASRCLEEGSSVLGPTGKEFSVENIGQALAMRELNAHLRETGELSGHNPSFTKKDRSRFLEALELAVRKVAEKGAVIAD